MDIIRAKKVLEDFVHPFFQPQIPEFLEGHAEDEPTPFEECGLDKDNATNTAVVMQFAAYLQSCGYWEV